MPGTHTIDTARDALPKLLELHDRGVTLLCPVCGAEVIAALDLATANRLGVHTGLVCSKERSHYHGLAETAEVREAFRALFPEPGPR